MLNSLANLLGSMQGFYLEPKSDLEKLRRDTLVLIYKAIELKLKEGCLKIGENVSNEVDR